VLRLGLGGVKQQLKAYWGLALPNKFGGNSVFGKTFSAVAGHCRKRYWVNFSARARTDLLKFCALPNPFIAMWAMHPFFGDFESYMTAQSPDCRRKALGWSH